MWGQVYHLAGAGGQQIPGKRGIKCSFAEGPHQPREQLSLIFSCSLCISLARLQRNPAGPRDHGVPCPLLPQPGKPPLSVL